MPAFFLLYHLFSNSSIGGESNGLLAHELFGAPLGGRWADALADGGMFGAAGLVYLALFALVAAVATFNFRRAKRMTADNPAVAGAAVGAGGGEQVPGIGAVNKVMPFMSFFT